MLIYTQVSFRSKINNPNFELAIEYAFLNLSENFSIKGFTPNWLEEISVIDKILSTKPITFRLVDLQGEAVTGSFCEPELQRTTQEVFRIEKAIRRDNKRKLALVKWRGYPEKFNSWVPMSKLNKLQ